MQLNKELYHAESMKEVMENGGESDEKMIDERILERLVYQQVMERKSWQGISVQHSGIPGTTSLLLNEGTLMFKEERTEFDAQEKIVDIFREILDLSLGLQPQKKSQFSISNDHFVKFKLFEIL